MDCLEEDFNGLSFEVTVEDLPSWNDVSKDTCLVMEPKGFMEMTPINECPPFAVNRIINRKLCLWEGNIQTLQADNIIVPSPCLLSERLENSSLPLEMNDNHGIPGGCRTGSRLWDIARADSFIYASKNVFFCRPARTAGEYANDYGRTLHSYYRTILEFCVKNNLRVVAFKSLSGHCIGMDSELGAHISLATLRRTIERLSSFFDRLVFVMDKQELEDHVCLLPYYFPRNSSEEILSCYLQPFQMGDQNGEPLLSYQDVRRRADASFLNQRDACEDLSSPDVSPHLSTSLSVGDHSFCQMEDDVDKQRLLGNSATEPESSQESHSVMEERHKRERYERLMQRARTEDLSEISGIDCLYQCGVDKMGRPIIVFIGKWFKFNEINLDKALLYLLFLLEPLVQKDYIIIYFHTITQAENHPSFQWIRHVYDVLQYKHRKNLKAFYIVHPTFWTKVMTWWFTTFMAPQIKHKVHTLTGVEYLYDIMEKDQLEVPAYIIEHDMTINGIRYYKSKAS